LPVQPVCAGTIDVLTLGSLVASGEQQNNPRSGDGVIDSISGANIDAQFPDSIAAKPVIAEVAQFHPVDSAVNCNLCPGVAELTTPFHDDIFLVRRQVMADLVHSRIIVYKRNNVKEI
jgi:hypothetical protein